MVNFLRQMVIKRKPAILPISYCLNFIYWQCDGYLKYLSFCFYRYNTFIFFYSFLHIRQSDSRMVLFGGMPFLRKFCPFICACIRNAQCNQSHLLTKYNLYRFRVFSISIHASTALSSRFENIVVISISEINFIENLQYPCPTGFFLSQVEATVFKMISSISF